MTRSARLDCQFDAFTTSTQERLVAFECRRWALTVERTPLDPMPDDRITLASISRGVDPSQFRSRPSTSRSCAPNPDRPDGSPRVS